METECLISSPLPLPVPEFNFDSASTSPFITAPSTPSFFTTAPLLDDDFEFDFNFSRSFHRPSSIPHADDLFSGGQIKPLKLPPHVQSPAKFLIEAAVSPKFKEKDFELFEESTKQRQREKQGIVLKERRETGRERKPRNRTRSLSPLRISDILSENEPSSPKLKTEKQSSLFSFPKLAWKRYKNWKLKDLFLFRSASEGRKDEIGHDSVKNYSLIRKNLEEDVNESSFRSTKSSGSDSGLGRSRKASLSAHEKHYTMNRAAQEEMKKKTPLPYKHGLMGMGCLGFEPAFHDFGRGFGSIRS